MSRANDLECPDEPESRVHPIPRWAFYGSVYAAATAAILIEVTLAKWSGLLLLPKNGSGAWIAMFVVSNIWLCYAIGDGLLKCLGLSRSGRVVEARGRKAPWPEEPSREADVVEAFWLGRHAKTVARMLLLIALMSPLAFVVPNLSASRDAGATLLLAEFGFGFALLFWWQGRQLIARVDGHGVTGYAAFDLFGRRRTIPWDSVATCEFITEYDPIGAPLGIRPILKDAAGATIMELNLKHLPASDQQRVAKAIAARLPKAMAEPWDDLV
jgi:hypothetical protein